MYSPPLDLDPNTIGVDASQWVTPDHPSPFGRVGIGSNIPIHPTARPPWWNLFSYRYERFSSSFESFQRAPPVRRLIRAEKLTGQVQKLIKVMLDNVYGDEEGQIYRSSVTRSASTSSDISRYRIRNYPSEKTDFLEHHQQTPQYPSSTTTEPYSSRLHSYSCPSSIGRLTYAQTIQGISTCLDALYFLIQAAQDLTDLPLVQIRYERLEELRLEPSGMGLLDIQYEIGNAISAILQKLVTYDEGNVRRLLTNRPTMLIHLEELSAWTSEDRERPYWRLEEGCGALRRIRDWKRTRLRGVMGAIRDWVVL